jgi:hypothetical protein
VRWRALVRVGRLPIRGKGFLLGSASVPSTSHPPRRRRFESVLLRCGSTSARLVTSAAGALHLFTDRR